MRKSKELVRGITVYNIILQGALQGRLLASILLTLTTLEKEVKEWVDICTDWSLDPPLCIHDTETLPLWFSWLGLVSTVISQICYDLCPFKKVADIPFSHGFDFYLKRSTAVIIFSVTSTNDILIKHLNINISLI